MKKNLFNETITDIHSWKTYWKSEEKYMPLVKHIYEINNMEFGNISTPPKSTNPVFRVGETILKVFYPFEKTLEDGGDYTAELEGLIFCKNLGVNVPDILCNGTIYDNLCSFPYIVMTCIDGVEAETVFEKYNLLEQVEFVKQLRKLNDTISITTNINIPRYDESLRINHSNWSIMPESFREDRKRFIENYDFPEPVFNQGDFAECNIIIDKQGRLNMIDFASCLIAPRYYEMPFWDEAVLMEAYYGDYKNDCFYDALLMDTLIYFGGAFNIKNDAKILGIDFNSITSVDVLKNILIERVNKIS